MNKFINPTELELQEETVVCINRVSKATTGGRAMRFNSLVVVGDGKGHVGLGFGKANEVASAVNKARENAKKTIFKVKLINGTIPHRIDIKYSSVRLMLKPASTGTGIIAGGPVPAHINPIWPFISFTAFHTLPIEFKKIYGIETTTIKKYILNFNLYTVLI